MNEIFLWLRLKRGTCGWDKQTEIENMLSGMRSVYYYVVVWLGVPQPNQERRRRKKNRKRMQCKR